MQNEPIWLPCQLLCGHLQVLSIFRYKYIITFFIIIIIIIITLKKFKDNTYIRDKEREILRFKNY